MGSSAHLGWILDVLVLAVFFSGYWVLLMVSELCPKFLQHLQRFLGDFLAKEVFPAVLACGARNASCCFVSCLLHPLASRELSNDVHFLHLSRIDFHLHSYGMISVYSSSWFICFPLIFGWYFAWSSLFRGFVCANFVSLAIA